MNQIAFPNAAARDGLPGDDVVDWQVGDRNMQKDTGDVNVADGE